MQLGILARANLPSDIKRASCIKGLRDAFSVLEGPLPEQ